MTNRSPSFKNKTIAALLASIGGCLGLYRFYLGGRRDIWAWLHFACLPLSLLLYFSQATAQPFFAFAPLILSTLGGFLACLIIGTMSDEKWDALFNPDEARKSDTNWPMALILVFTLGIGAGSLIAVIARSFDLLLTGGMYG